MKQMAFYLIVFCGVFTSIQCQENQTPAPQSNDDPTATKPVVSIPKFEPPSDAQAIKKWPKHNDYSLLQDPDSPYSPRTLSATTGPEFNVDSFDGAFKDVQKDAGITVDRDPVFEKLEAYEKWDGTDFRISLTPTKYNGVDGVLFLLISKPPKDKNYYIVGLEMTQQTFQEWGGVARVLALRGIINDVSVFPKDRQTQIATAPLDGQVRLYEETVNALQEKLLKEMVTLSQMQTIQLLQGIQFDQILNSELTSPFEND